MTRSHLHLVAIGFLISALPAAADAMPISALPSATATPIVRTAFGCGIGFTTGQSGRCIPNSFGFNNGRYSGPRPFFNRVLRRRCYIRRGYYGPRRVCRF